MCSCSASCGFVGQKTSRLSMSEEKAAIDLVFDQSVT